MAFGTKQLSDAQTLEDDPVDQVAGYLWQPLVHLMLSTTTTSEESVRH